MNFRSEIFPFNSVKFRYSKTFYGIKEGNLRIITAFVGIVVINQVVKEVVVEVFDWFVHHPSDESFTVAQTPLILGSDLLHTVQTLGGANFHLGRNQQSKVEIIINYKPFQERKILN